MKVTVTEAARLAKISRQQLYRAYINTGKISVIKDNNKTFIEFSELLRVFPGVTLATENDTIKLQQETQKTDTVTPVENEIVTLLKTQLAEAKERETWLRQQLEKVTLLIEDRTPKKKKKFLGIF